MTSTKRAFTLIELIVVIGMIVILAGAMTTSVAAARKRARIQRATAEVKSVSQAILAYENFAALNGQDLPTMERRDADAGALDFLIGRKSGGKGESGGRIPALLMAQLTGSEGVLRDPWGTPYKITIRQVSGTPRVTTASGSMQTGYYLPNFYRLSEAER